MPSEEELRAALDDIYGELKGVRPNKITPPRRKKKPVDHKSKGKPGRRSPVIDYVRSLGEDYRTTHEVAQILDVSENFVRKLAREDTTSAPSYVAPFGKTVVYLYTKEDIEELKSHLKERHQVMTREEYEDRNESKDDDG